jgi:hypothetical protein
MGLASGLDAEEFAISRVTEPEHSHWLRIWETLKFLHTVGSLDQWYPLAPWLTKEIVASHSLSFFNCEIIRHNSFHRSRGMPHENHEKKNVPANYCRNLH